MVSATFVADVSSFVQAMNRAEVALKDFDHGIGRIDRDLAKFGDQFSGRKLIQDAMLMSKSIDAIGGTSKLTQRELEFVSSKAKDAAEKMRAMGIDVPPKLQQLANAVTGSRTATEGFRGSLVQLAGAFGLGNIIGSAATAVAGWTKEAIASAGQITDLAAKTGLSTKEIQRMSFVADQTGTSLESFTKAAFMLGTRIAGDSGAGSVAGAVEKLGLNFRDLKSQAPEEQFNAIVRALEGVATPQERNTLAMQVFGKSASDILPAIAQGYQSIADQARIAGDAQLEAADRATDAASRAVTNIKTLITGAFGEAVLASEKAGTAIGAWFATKDRKEFDQFMAGLKNAETVTKQAGAATRDTSAHVATFVEKLAAAQKEADKLTTSERTQIAAAMKLGESQEDIANAFGVSEQALRLLSASTRENVKAIGAQDKALHDLVRTQMEALRQQGALNDEMTRASAAALGASAKDAFRKVRFTPTDDLFDVIPESIRDHADVVIKPSLDLKELQTTALRIGPLLAEATGDPRIDTLGERVGQDFSAGLNTALRSIGPTMVQSLMGGGDVLKATGSAFGLSLTEGMFGEDSQMAQSITKKFGERLGGAFNAVLPGIGALAGPLISGIGKLFSKAFGGPSEEEIQGRGVAAKFRAQLEQMISDAGRMEAGTDKWKLSVISLREQYVAAGHTAAEAEAAWQLLWKAEEKGGAAVQAVWDHINDTLAEHRAQLERTNEVLAKYGLDFTEQGEKIIGDWEELNELGFDQSTIIKAMGSELSRYVDHMNDLGLEIPETMRPLVALWSALPGATDAATIATNRYGSAVEAAATKTQKLWETVLMGANANYATGAGNGSPGTGGPSNVRLVDFLAANPGDIHRYAEGQTNLDAWGENITDPTLLAESRNKYDNEARNFIADNPDLFPGYATGTGGKYLNFGSGTPVTLHGRERVMTEAEGQAEAVGFADLLASQEMTRAQLRRMLDELPRAIQAAVALAV